MAQPIEGREQARGSCCEGYEAQISSYKGGEEDGVEDRRVSVATYLRALRPPRYRIARQRCPSGLKLGLRKFLQ